MKYLCFEEFNRITWCANASKYFATGRIDGYFGADVPDEFFKLLAIYIGSNQLSSVPWAIAYGEQEVQVMLNQAESVLESYNNYLTYIPSWYLVDYGKANAIFDKHWDHGKVS